MRFFTTTIRYLVVVNSLISIGYAAHHFPFGGSINGMKGAIKHAVCSTVTPRFAQATHPMAMGILAADITLFKAFCNGVFMQPVPINAPRTLWVPHTYDPRNTFLQFRTPSASTEIHISPDDIWSDTSMIDTTPKSDTGQPSIVYNLITDPRNKTDRSFMLTSARKIVNPSVVYVTQMGLGADCLQQSRDPETKAWIEFLTHAHEKQDIPAKTPDSVAEAYQMIDFKTWSKETLENYKATFASQKPLTLEDLENVIGIIDYCLDQSYPLATMVKYTGLCPTAIKKIIDQLNLTPGL